MLQPLWRSTSTRWAISRALLRSGVPWPTRTPRAWWALLPLVDAWYCCDLPTPRAASAAQLAEAIQQVRTSGASLTVPAAATFTHPDPMSALKAALAAANPEDRIVVFGSFSQWVGCCMRACPRERASFEVIHLPSLQSRACLCHPFFSAFFRVHRGPTTWGRTCVCFGGRRRSCAGPGAPSPDWHGRAGRAGVIGFPWLFETKPPHGHGHRSGPACCFCRRGGDRGAQTGRSGTGQVGAAKPDLTSRRSAGRQACGQTCCASCCGFKAPEPRVAEAKKAVESDRDTKDAKDAKPAAKGATAGDKPASAAAVRYVIQIGAFSDQPTAREARMKAERAGLKTYTQVIGADANRKDSCPPGNAV